MQVIGQYLVIDPEVCHGQMTFHGTRIPVDTVLSYLAKGYSVEQLVQSWPELTVDAVKEAVILAADSLQDRYLTSSARMPATATA
jgi:uncharacterized protein (DUF433 family)